MCAVSECGKEWSVQAKNPDVDRLTTSECFEFILSLPIRHTKIFSYSFNYDITKMITDMDSRSIYRLMRPNLKSRKRRGKGAKLGPIPIEWVSPENGETYLLNLLGTKFSVQSRGKRVVIWDLFRFFQGKFVKALTEWKVGSPELLKRMQEMKDKRSLLDRESFAAVIRYCTEECLCMAQLARKLVTSHESAGLELRTYYGAGSSGAAMLTAMGIKNKLAETPLQMRYAASCAFAGGRFENSVIGTVRENLQGWDISSAYPYQLTFLPCLEHGHWEHITSRTDLEKAEAQNGALVRYELRGSPGIRASWGPFPFRTKGGSISFPIESGGGWVWLDEFLAGERIYSHVRFREAFIYRNNCGCRPFEKIPEYYNLRLKIGKEGPGLVIKLGVNSCYGKLAQSVGNALYNSWIWAGMITSGCRAQILHMLSLHKDQSNLLMIATDGIVTRETLCPPDPLLTNTASTGKPLGGWEFKDNSKGLFFARPGVYFPLEPTIKEIASVRARGVGRGVILESWRKIVKAWETDGVEGKAVVSNVTRFCGAKTSISISGNGNVYNRASATDGQAPSYGQWIARNVAMSFNPLPKREKLNPDGLTLELRRFHGDEMSAPYLRALQRYDPETMEMRTAELEMLEQPDGDFSDYE